MSKRIVTIASVKYKVSGMCQYTMKLQIMFVQLGMSETLDHVLCYNRFT